MSITIQDMIEAAKNSTEVSEWIYNKLLEDLEEDERALADSVHRAVADYEKAGDAYEEALKKCTHPLTFRTYYNRGSSGSYYERGTYWTEHTCEICQKRWNTSQSWENIGDGTGLPNSSSEEDGY